MDKKDKERKKYFEILQEISKKYPEEKRIHFDLALYYLGRSMQDDAEAELKKAIELDPEYGYALNQLAYMYSNKNDFEKALEYFKRYASVSPGDANPFDSMGEMYFRMGKLDESIEKFKEALEVKPDFSSDWKISYIYALKEDYGEAIRWVDQFISTAPSVPWQSLGHQLKGFYFYILGDLDQAFTEIDKSEELVKMVKDNNLIDIAYRMKLWICYEWGKIDLFQEYQRKRMDFRIRNNLGDDKENTIITNFYTGLADLKTGQIEAAKSKLSVIQSILSDMDEEKTKHMKTTIQDYFHSLILLEEGSADEAIALIEKMPPPKVSFSAIVSFVRRNLPFDDDLFALAYLKKGEMNKAIKEYERITSLNLDIGLDRPIIHPLSRYRLAKLYEEIGQKAKAIEQYSKSLEIWKTSEEGLFEVGDARERLETLMAETSKKLDK
jgi:tetratricopeptide (TPR) repeat protein